MVNAADDAVGDEAVDAPFYCGGGEADPLADVAVARAGVLAKHVEDAVVEIVHTGNHTPIRCVAVTDRAGSVRQTPGTTGCVRVTLGDMTLIQPAETAPDASR